MIEERKLKNLLEDKNREAIKVFYQENYKMIFRLAYKFTNNKEDAEDILQETFVRALKNIKKLKIESSKSLKNWLLRICINISIDFLRKKKVEFFLRTKIRAQEQSNPEKKMEKRELKEKMERAISSLSPKQRVVFTLKYLDDFKIKDISEVLGTSENTIKKHLQRSVKKIEKILGGLR